MYAFLLCKVWDQMLFLKERIVSKATEIRCVQTYSLSLHKEKDHWDGFFWYDKRRGKKKKKEKEKKKEIIKKRKKKKSLHCWASVEKKV